MRLIREGKIKARRRGLRGMFHIYRDSVVEFVENLRKEQLKK